MTAKREVPPPEPFEPVEFVHRGGRLTINGVAIPGAYLEITPRATLGMMAGRELARGTRIVITIEWRHAAEIGLNLADGTSRVKLSR